MTENEEVLSFAPAALRQPGRVNLRDRIQTPITSATDRAGHESTTRPGRLNRRQCCLRGCARSRLIRLLRDDRFAVCEFVVAGAAVDEVRARVEKEMDFVVTRCRPVPTRPVDVDGVVPRNGL
jgi:hypothetical protein